MCVYIIVTFTNDLFTFYTLIYIDYIFFSKYISSEMWLSSHTQACGFSPQIYNLKGQFELLDEMVKLGLQGVECFSSYHSEEVNQYFYNKAKELNILYTCGSDFHGKTKPSIKLGGHHSQVEEEIKENLRKYHLI